MISKKKNALLAVIFCSVFFGGVGCFLYSVIFGANAQKTHILLLEKPTTIKALASKISDNLKSEQDILWTARLKKITVIKAGRYEIKKGMSSNEILTMLRNHLQKPLNLTFNNVHSLEILSEKIAQKTKATKQEFFACFMDEAFLKRERFTKQTALAMYLPDTYKVYWDITPEKFREKMLRTYQKFWNDKQLQKAKKIGLTPLEVMTLASIVHLESKHKKELPTIAGLYLNRLKKHIPLQADPTIVFALKKMNEKTGRKMRRVLKKDLKIKSPYNTYTNRGLPPGPIAMPDKTAIRAVLNAEKHKYIYMCANAEKLGSHVFATSLKDHLHNAYLYHQWLKNNGIKK